MSSKGSGIKATDNVMIGKGTFIKAPGYKNSIEADGNMQVGGGIFIDTSEETKTPEGDKAADKTSSKFARIIDKLVFPVSAGLILAFVLGSFTFLRPRFGF